MSQTNAEHILSNIQSLQQMEQQVHSNLESNPTITVEERSKLLEKMNQLSGMRLNLYDMLKHLKIKDVLKDQSNAIDIVETELNRAKKRIEALEQEKHNKIRLIEINTYYGDRYAEHTQIMKIAILTLAPIVGLTMIKPVLPDKIYTALIVIIACIGAYYFWTRLMSIYMRDNMNYDEYNWNVPTENPTTVSPDAVLEDPWSIKGQFGTCIGNSCCSDGLKYDSAKNQCVL